MITKKLRFVYIVMFLFMAFLLSWSIYKRNELLVQYNQGVQFYKEANYEAAMDTFEKLQGWGDFLEVSPKEYYNRAQNHLLNKNKGITKCPYCGANIQGNNLGALK